MRTIKTIRIGCRDICGNASYFVIKHGEVFYFADNLTPLAIANVAGSVNAAVLRFALEDARSPEEAFKAVKKYAQHAKEVWYS
jgi:hypothetical protein